MNTVREGSVTVVFPEGRIDSSNAEAFGEELRQIVNDSSGRIILDARDLQYISSAGLRVLLTFIREDRDLISIRNANSEVYGILETTGFTELMDVFMKMRSISIEDCKKIGEGALGHVYRIDPDTIVKVFKSRESLPAIRLEQQRSRMAFVKGIPTAIPFDIVQVGDQYGAVYELIDAKNMNDELIGSPDRMDDLIRRYVELLRKVHATEMRPGDLPAARDIFLQYVRDLECVLPPETAARLRQLLQQMPEDLRLVHGDFQMKNVMMSGRELMLIDMETLCVGNPVFDLQALYVAYRAFNEAEPQNSERFFGLSDETCAAVWEQILAEYFKNDPPERIREMEARIRTLAYIRFLDRVVTHGMTAPELKETRVRQATGHLEELLEKVDTLAV